MKIRTKVYLVITVATAALATLLIASGLYFFGLYSRATEREHALMAAELVQTELVMRLMAGNFNEAELVHELSDVIPALHSVRIARTDAVVRQYGGADDVPRSEEERQVLTTTSPVGMLVESDQGVFFRYVAPYAAEASEEKNCLACHDVQEGTLLGSVTLELDLTRQRFASFKYTGGIVAFLVAFAIPLAYSLRRLLLPIVDATVELHEVVGKAEQGDFSGRLAVHRGDEIGRISEQTNRLMTTLEDSFGTIVKDVETLSGHHHDNGDRNLLKHTVTTVKSMVDAVRVRQTIEADRDLDEIYDRIRSVLKSDFGLTRCSLYDVDLETDRLRRVFAEGLPENGRTWCSDEILVDGRACRARRTAQEVNSVAARGICGAFAGDTVAPEQGLAHVCMPLLLGGSVGGVLQILLSAGEARDVHDRLHTIRRHLEEAAPVIESKRLTQILRESTLKDPMTGLYNRRFLEQFSERLTSMAERRQTGLALLMCDLDSFKEMNDVHGHQMGDAALREAVRVINVSVRHSDFVIRMGGDEFLALLSDASVDKALEVAERIRSSLEANRFKVSGRELKLTLSLGVSVYPKDSDDFDECMKFADAALYKAKESGSNVVVRFNQTMLNA
jgi:diguanylate cyclase (GGDEF)-like protein